MIRKISLIAALVISGMAISQKIKITELHISNGTGFGGQMNGSIDDFKILAPNSSILAMDFSQYNPHGFPSYQTPGMNMSSSYSLQLGLQCAKMPKVTYRVGITHVSNAGVLSAHGTYFQSFPYDTLTSSQTGEQTFIDSSNTKHYNMNHSNQQIRLDGAMIFRMFPEKRWSLHTGLGASIGMSYQSNTDISFWETSSMSSGNYYGDYYGNQNVERESYKNKNSIGASLYIPFGIDFGIGKKREFWMPFHLYVETRPSLNINSINGIGTTFSPGMSSTAGLRIKI
jgi:hypothetical protein